MSFRPSAVLLLTCALGCGREPPAPTARPTSEPPPGPAPVCQTAEARCVDDSTRETCRDGAAWERETCDGATICGGGACISLATPSGTAVDRRSLLTIADRGWLSAWSVSAPLQPKLVERFEQAPDDPTIGGGNLEWKDACSDSGFVSAFASAGERQKPPAFALLAAWIVVPREGRYRVKAGVSGAMRLYAAGRRVLDVRRTASLPALADEVEEEVQLAAGPQLFAAVVEQLEEQPPGFWLRIHDDRNSVPVGLAVAPFKTAGCRPGATLSVEPKITPVRGGFEVGISPGFSGPRPRGAGPLSLRADLLPMMAAEPPALLGTLSMPLDRKADAWTVKVLFDRPATRRIAVSVAGAGDVVSARADAKGQSGGARISIELTFSGDVHDRIVRLIEQRTSTLERSRAMSEGSRASWEHHVSRLERALVEGERDRPWLTAQTAAAERIGAALASGRDPYREEKGYVYRAYRSPLDGRLQPYVAFVPSSYKPDKKMPLVFAYHGKDRLPEHGMRTVLGAAPDDTMSLSWAARHLPPIGDIAAIVVAPWGYGNAGPRVLGEEDLLAVLAEMKSAYSIDERRVSITGYSLGGTVAFLVPLRNPDLFSASAPLCGYPNLLGYESVRTVEHAPWEDVLLQKRYIVNYAENGLHLPLHIVHGGKDGPGRSQVVADRYRELGYERIFDVQDDLDHNVWDYGYEDGKMVAWLKVRRRPALPHRVRLVTGEYRYDRSFWLRVIAIREQNVFADVDARWLEKDGRLEVKTSNVSAFAVDAATLGLPAESKADVDGVEIALPSVPRIFFERTEGTWRASTEEPSRAGKKRRGVSGPIDESLRHPLLVVYGTADPTQTETNRMVAEHFSSWDAWAGASFPVRADAEVKPPDLAGKSIVLVGNPTSNTLTRSIVDRLPVRFDSDAITLRGVRYAGPDVGVSFIHPSPLDPDQVIVLHAGVRHSGTLASRNLPQLVPDWIVYDARQMNVQRGELLLDQRKALAGGFFGDDWK